MTNAARHAAAGRIEVVLAATPQILTATVRDDGRGFDVRAALQPARQPFGLLGMRERVAVFGGSVDVTSETSVVAGDYVTGFYATAMATAPMGGQAATQAFVF